MFYTRWGSLKFVNDHKSNSMEHAAKLNIIEIQKHFIYSGWIMLRQYIKKSDDHQENYTRMYILRISQL